MKKILLGVSGSISAYKVLDLITAVRQAGVEVHVVMTKDAGHFITPLVLQSFSGTKVHHEFFSLDYLKPIHIELAKQSDLIVLAPASADVVAKIAHGFADDLVSATVLASQAPLVIAPAMNEKMYENPATQENIQKLKSRGAIIVDPIVGHLVCSDKGMGHLADISTLLKVILQKLSL